jgi:aerobic-type carbon monoxide dehydrogenase small subunit (CoxS/CutS family)
MCRNLDAIKPAKLECAGKDCKNVGIHYLKIAFLNQFGWFCADCTNGLIEDRLAADEKEVS